MKASHGFTLAKKLRLDEGGKAERTFKKRIIFNLEGVKRNLEFEDRV